MRYKYFLQLLTFIGCSMLFSACEPQELQQKTLETSTQTVEEELPDLSIFHLPSKWATQSNDTIELVDLRGKVTVLALIFTSCQYACPRLVADMKGIEEEVAANKRSETNFVLVSIDPENDTPEVLHQFAEEKELDLSHWTLLQGTPDSVLELAVTLGVKYRKVSAIDFSHSNIISVFEPNGELVFQQDGFGADNTDIVGHINELLKK